MNRRTFVGALLALPFVRFFTKEEPQLEYYWENPPKEYDPNYVSLCKVLKVPAIDFHKKISLVQIHHNAEYDSEVRQFKNLRKGDTFRLLRYDGSNDDWTVALYDAYPSDTNGNRDDSQFINWGVKVEKAYNIV